MKRITLIPAYGRDYKSKKALMDDFDGDKDFIIQDFFNKYDGKPCNKSDLKRDDYNVAEIQALKRMWGVELPGSRKL